MNKPILVSSLTACLIAMLFVPTAMAGTNHSNASSYALTAADLGGDLHKQTMAVVPVLQPPHPAPPTVIRPNLASFHLAFSKQPLLTEYGFATLKPAKNHAVAYEGTVAQVIQKILPYGWHVYTKNHLANQMGFPVMINGQGKTWTENLKDALKQSGLHGAIWWGPQILTLWSAPMMPSYQPKPNLQDFKVASLPARSPISLPKSHVSAGANISATSPKVPVYKPQLSNFHVGPATQIDQLQSAKPVFMLNRGDLILIDLKKWAKRSGWTVVWQVPEDWQVPNTTTFNGDFHKAVSQVIQALSVNGANIHAVFHMANNTVVISGAGGGE